jgi:hypothetical protein
VITNLNLLNDKEAIQRTIETYEQQRIDAMPKTYEEWEEKVLNKPVEELDTTVYWQEIEEDPLYELDRLITSLG